MITLYVKNNSILVVSNNKPNFTWLEKYFGTINQSSRNSDPISDQVSTAFKWIVFIQILLSTNGSNNQTTVMKVNTVYITVVIKFI